MSNFWDILWLIFSSFMFVAYLMILFHVVVDLFRDTEVGGLAKALWIVGLVFLPMLTALVYVITRGKGMAEGSAPPRSGRSPTPTPTSGGSPGSRRRSRLPTPRRFSMPAPSTRTSSGS